MWVSVNKTSASPCSNWSAPSRAQSSSQLDVFRLDSDAFCVDGAQICVSEERYEESFSGFLESHDGLALPSIGTVFVCECLRNFSYLCTVSIRALVLGRDVCIQVFGKGVSGQVGLLFFGICGSRAMRQCLVYTDAHDDQAQGLVLQLFLMSADLRNSILHCTCVRLLFGSFLADPVETLPPRDGRALLRLVGVLLGGILVVCFVLAGRRSQILVATVVERK